MTALYSIPTPRLEQVTVNHGLLNSPDLLGWLFTAFLICAGLFNAGAPPTSVPLAFTVQITDVDLEHKWFTEPKSSLFLANCKPTYQTTAGVPQGGFPNLLTSPYPVVGRGAFKIDIQDTSGTQQRVELVIGVLEVCDAG